MTMPDGSFGTPYSLSEAQKVAEHAQSADWDVYHRELFEWLISEIELLRSDEWLEKAAEEMAPMMTTCSTKEVAGATVLAILRKHRDGLK